MRTIRTISPTWRNTNPIWTAKCGYKGTIWRSIKCVIVTLLFKEVKTIPWKKEYRKCWHHWSYFFLWPYSNLNYWFSHTVLHLSFDLAKWCYDPSLWASPAPLFITNCYRTLSWVTFKDLDLEYLMMLCTL